AGRLPTRDPPWTQKLKKTLIPARACPASRLRFPTPAWARLSRRKQLCRRRSRRRWRRCGSIGLTGSSRLQSASKPGNLPENLDSIPNKDRIGTQNDIRFKIRLGHQEAVERVFRMRWQILQGEYVRESNCE